MIFCVELCAFSLSRMRGCVSDVVTALCYDFCCAFCCYYVFVVIMCGICCYYMLVALFMHCFSLCYERPLLSDGFYVWLHAFVFANVVLLCCVIML